MDEVYGYLDELLCTIESADRPSEELASIVKGPAYDVVLDLLDDVKDDQPIAGWSTVRVALDGLIDYLQASNDVEAVFYERLWSEITQNALFSSREMQSTALLFLLSHSALPYCQVGDFSMDLDEFHKRKMDLEGELRTIFTLYNRELPERLQKESALLDVIESREDHHDRVMLLSFLLSLGDE